MPSFTLPVNLAEVSTASQRRYPPGFYIFEVKDATIMPTKAGDKMMMKVSMEIVMGPGPDTELAGVAFTRYYTLTEKAAPFFRRFLLAVSGLSEEQISALGSNLPSEYIIGRQFMGEIMVKDNGREELRGEAPISEWTHGAVVGGAAPQPSLLGAMPSPTAPPAPQMPQAAAQPVAAPPAMQAPGLPVPPPQAAPVAPVAPAVAPAPAPMQPQVPGYPQQVAPQVAPQVAQPQAAPGLPAPPPAVTPVPQG